MNIKIDASVHELWNEFVLNNSTYGDRPMPKSWFFCDNKKAADECAQLVVDGIKQATATSIWWYETNNQHLPNVGDLYIITNWEGKAKAIIQTSNVEKVPFGEITQEFAEIEGEGDKSLEYWKKVHWAYFTREMKDRGTGPTEDMIIVCEQFKTIWTESSVPK